MKELTHINMFLFDHAQYNLKDVFGNNILLKVDYKNNQYQILSDSSDISDLVNEEISNFARDLLKRKSGKNFIEV